MNELKNYTGYGTEKSELFVDYLIRISFIGIVVSGLVAVFGG